MDNLTKEQISKGLAVLSAEEDSKLYTHLNACVHCGLCAESCVYYKAFGDPEFIPAKKVELINSIYQRYHSNIGKIAPFLSNAKKLDDKIVLEMVDSLFGACTLCGRCVSHCSIGVDIEYVVRKGRAMLAEMGLVPASLQKTVDAALNTGNNMGIPTDELIETIEWLEEDLQMEVEDDDARIPLNKKDVQIMYTLNPREPKFFPLSISAMAKVFYAAGESWTLSTEMYDVTNYAYFSCHDAEAEVISQRMYDEMKKLKAKRLVLAECGHGTRANRWEAPNYLKKEYDFDLLTSIELMADYIREGQISVDPALNSERVTIHDPCNLVRSGGIFQEQRYILKNCCSDFVEMTPFGYDNYCCGGGGGQLSMSEYNERRMEIGKIKAGQIKKTGAKIVVTPCHNCVDQLLQLNAAYKLNVSIKTVAEIVADAIVLNKK
jgi:Fe-S oxidoreductase